MKGLAFYEAAATLIPILAIAALLLGPRGMPRVWPYMSRSLRLVTFGALALVVVGEWRALRVLQTEDASTLVPTSAAVRMLRQFGKSQQLLEDAQRLSESEMLLPTLVAAAQEDDEAHATARSLGLEDCTRL